MPLPSNDALRITTGPTFNIPPHDTQTFTYVAAGAADDDDVETITYSRGGTTVAVLTYTYVGGTNNVATAVLTVP